MYLQGANIQGGNFKIVSGDLNQNQILVQNGEFGIWFRPESREIEIRRSSSSRYPDFEPGDLAWSYA